MACLICERSAKYELVRDGQPEAEVCEACTEEFLAVDEADPTCVYCDRNGVYDVRTGESGGFPEAEDTGDTFATPYESVLCEEHFEDLGGEEPAGSPEAADEEDVPDEEAEDEAEAEAEAGAEAEADGESEAEAQEGEEEEVQEGDSEEETDSDGDAGSESDADDAEDESESRDDGDD